MSLFGAIVRRVGSGLVNNISNASNSASNRVSNSGSIIRDSSSVSDRGRQLLDNAGINHSPNLNSSNNRNSSSSNSFGNFSANLGHTLGQGLLGMAKDPNIQAQIQQRQQMEEQQRILEQQQAQYYAFMEQQQQMFGGGGAGGFAGTPHVDNTAEQLRREQENAERAKMEEEERRKLEYEQSLRDFIHAPSDTKKDENLDNPVGDVPVDEGGISEGRTPDELEQDAIANRLAEIMGNVQSGRDTPDELTVNQRNESVTNEADLKKYLKNSGIDFEALDMDEDAFLQALKRFLGLVE